MFPKCRRMACLYAAVTVFLHLSGQTVHAPGGGSLVSTGEADALGPTG